MILTDLEESLYHSRPELSSTQARDLLKTPALYKFNLTAPREPKQAFDVGTAAHSKILGVGAGIVVYPEEHLTPSGNVSTKAATVEWAQAQRDAGLVPVGTVEAERVDAMAEAVLADPDAREVLERISGREVSIITDVEGVPVRARFDMYDGTHAGDLKTTRDASPRGFNKSIASFGYHLQEQWYRDAHKAETGRELESFEFVVVEAAPPHLVAVYDVDFSYREAARTKAREARELWLRCTETDTWPGYGRQTLIAPTWVVIEDEEVELKL